MSTHLTEHEITAAVVGGELTPAAEGHLLECLPCRRRVGELTSLLAERRRQVAAEEPDWDAQRRAVMSALPTEPAVVIGRSHPHRWLRPLLAAAAVLLVAVGVGHLLGTGPGVVAETEQIPLEQILAEADALLSDEAIPGFDVVDPGLGDLDTFTENGAS